MLSSDLSKLFPIAEPTRMRKPTEATTEIPQDSITERKEAASGGENLPQGSGKEEAEPQKVEAAVGQLNDFVQSIKRDLEFNVDEDSGRVVIKVIDSETKEVIRQIPPEDILAMVRDLDGDAGMFVHVEA